MNVLYETFLLFIEILRNLYNMSDKSVGGSDDIIRELFLY